VLAYTEGEEPFIDANGNNKYDVGETFFDMGQPFLDANENGTWDAAPAEQKVGDASTPGAGIGTTACLVYPALTPNPLQPNVANTCDGVWGATRVRASRTITFATSFAQAPVFFDISASGVSLVLADQLGNAMPSGTTVSATISGGVNCTVQSVVPQLVPSTTDPTTHRVIISKGSAVGDTCIGAEVSVQATTPKGNQTLLGKVVITP